MIGYIYTLNDDNNVPIYVGSTTLPLKQRLQGHISSLKNYNYPVYKYIRSNCKDISISLLEEVVVENKKELVIIENNWITTLSNKGVNLLNRASNKLLIDSGTSLVKERWENVKLKKEAVEKVRNNQRVTGVSMSFFIEKLIDTALPDKPKKSKK